MSELFLNVLNTSISAGWIVLVVVVLRLLFKKLPKWMTVLLWGIVGFRLVFPFSIESKVSLIPSGQTVPTDIATSHSPSIDSGVPVINNVINSVISENFTPAHYNSTNPLQVLILVMSVVWVVGILAMLAYVAISYLKVRKKVNAAVPLIDNIYECQAVGSPFVLGIIKPKIYLPYNVMGQEMEYVIAHEQSHIDRKDHLWKPLGFLILSIYWFNPLMWLAYILLCRDIELACDEKVINKLGSQERADYSQALLNCSINKRTISACPLAFGEIGVKKRIKSVLSYKKPTFWKVIMAVVTIVLTATCLLTSPPKVKAYGSNTLLYALSGTNDLNYIEDFQIIHKYDIVNTQITNNSDLEFLKEYSYSHEYPNDKLQKLFAFPETQMFKIKCEGRTRQIMYLMNDGSITLQTIKRENDVTVTTYGVYTADKKYALLEKALINLLKKYDGYKIVQD